MGRVAPFFGVGSAFEAHHIDTGLRAEEAEQFGFKAAIAERVFAEMNEIERTGRICVTGMVLVAGFG